MGKLKALFQRVRKHCTKDVHSKSGAAPPKASSKDNTSGGATLKATCSSRKKSLQLLRKITGFVSSIEVPGDPEEVSLPSTATATPRGEDGSNAELDTPCQGLYLREAMRGYSSDGEPEPGAVPEDEVSDDEAAPCEQPHTTEQGNHDDEEVDGESDSEPTGAPPQTSIVEAQRFGAPPALWGVNGPLNRVAFCLMYFWDRFTREAELPFEAWRLSQYYAYELGIKEFVFARQWGDTN